MMIPGRFHRGPGTVVSYSAGLSLLQGTQMQPLYDRERCKGRENRGRREGRDRREKRGNEKKRGYRL